MSIMLHYLVIFVIGLVSFMPTHASVPPAAKQSLVLILLGPPGCGKGTQAVSLSKALHIPHISTGDLFRANIKQQTALGLKAQEFINNGQLVPDSLVLDMLFERLKQPDCLEGFLLDGVPRTVAQAQELATFLKAHTQYHLVVVQIMLSDETIIQRLSGRRTCQNCGRIYHLQTQLPQTTGICDICKGTLIQRSDDTPDVIRKRLQTYHEQTKPVEDFYQNSTIVHQVDGSKPAAEVLEAIQEMLQTDVKQLQTR